MYGKDGSSGFRMSPLNAWSFSFACIIGWGAFVLPGSFFLPEAGLWSSVLALLLGALSMCLIVYNYRSLSNLHGVSGGIYYIVSLSMNRKAGFASSWLMELVYLSCFTLNANALAMLTRNAIEDITVYRFSTDLIPGEIRLADFIIIVLYLAAFTWISIRGIRKITRVQTVGALVLLGGIIVMLIAAHIMPSEAAPLPSISDQSPESFLRGVMSVFVLTPWAFVGFDAVGEVNHQTLFRQKYLGYIMVLAVFVGGFAYIANIFTAVRGISGELADWVRQMKNPAGGHGAASYTLAVAAKQALGKPGIAIFYLSAMSAALTGMIGFSLAGSERMAFLAQEHFLPPRLGRIDPKYGTPRNAILAFSALALLLFFFLNSLSFIEELASFAAALGYAYVSLSALRMAVVHKKKAMGITGALGLLFCLIWIVFMTVNLFGMDTVVSRHAVGSMAVWIFLGIGTYCIFTRKDP